MRMTRIISSCHMPSPQGKRSFVGVVHNATTDFGGRGNQAVWTISHQHGLSNRQLSIQLALDFVNFELLQRVGFMVGSTIQPTKVLSVGSVNATIHVAHGIGRTDVGIDVPWDFENIVVLHDIHSGDALKVLGILRLLVSQCQNQPATPV